MVKKCSEKTGDRRRQSSIPVCPKTSQPFAAAAAKESPIIFSGDMRG